MNATRKRYIIRLSVLLVVMFLVTQITSFHIGKDDSLPQSYFISLNFITPKRGDLAVIAGHKTKYFKNLEFIKRIVGIAGDKVQIVGSTIMVDKKQVGRILTKTKFNKPLSTIKLKNNIIPKGYVFVAGIHERSFDSRYKEFGLVKVVNIKGKAYGF